MASRRPEMSRLTQLSKALSWLLRHNAEREGYKFLPGGFLYVDDVLQHNRFRGFSPEDVKRVVETNDKQRFALMEEEESKRLKIRANQGHSLQVEDLGLTPITSAAEIPVVVHGTSLAHWSSIRSQGLSRMRRNHIHFAPGEPGEDGVISGMRQSSQVLIFIDAEKALADGIPFLRSANNVILSPGDSRGTIPPRYFKTVLEAATRKELAFRPEGSAEHGTKEKAAARTAEKTEEKAEEKAEKAEEKMEEKAEKAEKAEEKADRPRQPIPGLPMTAEQLAAEIEKHKKKKKKKKKKKRKSEDAEDPAEED